MNIIVCLKQTFDTEEKIVVEDGVIDDDGAEFIINPYCEYAVEEAIRLKEKHGGKVTLITVGTEQSEQAIRTAMAMGADEGYRIDLEEFSDAVDELTISTILAQLITEEDIAYDLILSGYMSIDQGTAQVGPRLAELLNIPHISTITKVEITGEQVTVEKDVEGDTETITSQLPLLLTAQQGLNEPRYPKLPDIMKAKRKPLHQFAWDDLDLKEDQLRAKTKEVAIFTPPAKQAGKILSGDSHAQVQELVHLLQNEAKVIN